MSQVLFRVVVASALLAFSVVTVSAQGVAEADAAFRMSAAIKTEQERYEKLRFGQPPKLSPAIQEKVEAGLSKLPEHRQGIIQRMLKGERPTELPGNRIAGIKSMKPGEFGILDNGYLLVEILSDKASRVSLLNVGIPAVVVGVETGPMFIGRHYPLKQFVAIRKSDDFPELEVEKGTLLIEVVDDPEFRSLVELIYPSKRPTRQKRK